MKITIPRPLEVNTRIYGLGIRQFIYLGAGLALAFFVALLIPATGIVRLLVGGAIFLAALALAFMKVRGHYLDGHISNFLKYILSPRTRVWHKEDDQIQFVYDDVQFNDPKPTKAKTISFELRKEESIPASLAIAAVNLIIILILGGTIYYMYFGGFRDIQYWLNRGSY